MESAVGTLTPMRTTMPPPICTLGPQDFPVPFGIDADTGALLPGLTASDLDRIDPDRKEVRQRGDPSVGDHLAIVDIDPNNLEQAGWCVLFARDVDPAVKSALAPLLAHRESQAKRLFKVFEGDTGLRPGDDARKWIERQGASFAVVDPENGIPVYVLIVGSPAQIPFEFQYLLDLYWNVGRLHFDTTDEYRHYAESVVDYETSASVPHKKRAAIFSVRHLGDRPTALLHDQLAEPLIAGSSTMRSLAGNGFRLTPLLAAAATKERLSVLLSGREDGGAPAFLFTGSHGVKFRMTDPAQRDKQGALLCQDWPGAGAPEPRQMFAAADVPDDARVHGLIHFLFACYGGGCPTHDSFGLRSGETPKPLVEQPIVAKLPQRLLAKGALASLAHVDRAWAYSFQNSRGAPQLQEMREVMVRILRGERIGQATDKFNMRWAVLAAELHESQNLRESFANQVVSDAELANRFVARNDARNYVILGDPAVRLRTDAMTE
jgi:hypothetical protein